MAILDFSVSGWHGFGSVTQVCFGISVSNFMCMSFVAVGRIFSAMSLSKWLRYDFEQCHPLLWGGGILVDHWSTISIYNVIVFENLNMHVRKLYIDMSLWNSQCDFLPLTSATMILPKERNAAHRHFRLKFGPIIRLQHNATTWWRHPMEAFSSLLALSVG